MTWRLVAAGAATVVLVPAAAHGAWTDTATVSGSTVTAATVAPPTLTCQSELVGVTFTWSSVPDARDYVFHLAEGSAGEVVSGTRIYVASLVGGGSATVVARRGFTGTSTVWSSGRSNAVAWGSLVVSGCR